MKYFRHLAPLLVVLVAAQALGQSGGKSRTTPAGPYPSDGELIFGIHSNHCVAVRDIPRPVTGAATLSIGNIGDKQLCNNCSEEVFACWKYEGSRYGDGCDRIPVGKCSLAATSTATADRGNTLSFNACAPWSSAPRDPGENRGFPCSSWDVVKTAPAKPAVQRPPLDDLFSRQGGMAAQPSPATSRPAAGSGSSLERLMSAQQQRDNAEREKALKAATKEGSTSTQQQGGRAQAPGGGKVSEASSGPCFEAKTALQNKRNAMPNAASTCADFVQQLEFYEGLIALQAICPGDSAVAYNAKVVSGYLPGIRETVRSCQ